jgi:hypothetical protein
LIIFFGTAPYIGIRIGETESVGIVQLLMPLFTGYLGLILGFYFGTKDHK